MLVCVCVCALRVRGYVFCATSYYLRRSPIELTCQDSLLLAQVVGLGGGCSLRASLSHACRFCLSIVYSSFPRIFLSSLSTYLATLPCSSAAPSTTGSIWYLPFAMHSVSWAYAHANGIMEDRHVGRQTDSKPTNARALPPDLRYL